MASADVVVVGGGIAGLSVLAALSEALPGIRGCLIEREKTLGAHASGRNAAIHRPLERDATTARLVLRSRTLMAELADDAFLDQSGLLLVGGPSTATDPIESLHRHALAQGVAVEALDAAQLAELAPHLAGGDVCRGLRVEGGGVLDIHGMLDGLRRLARSKRHAIRTGVAVSRVRVEAGRVTGVELSDGTQLSAPHVVLGAGAWGRSLGESCGTPLPLSPVRRHLVQLQGPAVCGPVVWRLDGEIYLRPEGAGFLASPCDATPWEAEDPPSDPEALELLADKLGRMCPSHRTAEVQSYWACLRTFAPDGELIAGPDARLPGLHWLAGLGGRGMSVGPAAGELVAQGIAGDFDPAFAELLPERVL